VNHNNRVMFGKMVIENTMTGKMRRTSSNKKKSWLPRIIVGDKDAESARDVLDWDQFHTMSLIAPSPSHSADRSRLWNRSVQ